METPLDKAAPPADLVPELHEVWGCVLEDMRTRPVGSPTAYRDVDMALVRALVEAIWLHRDSSRIIHEFGVLVAGANGPQKNPAINAQKDAAAQILRLSDALGLNPGARVRLGVMELAGLSILASLNSQLDV
ncbi:MAG: P27 family phage terminase small subunit [Actinomycetes bacterium]